MVVLYCLILSRLSILAIGHYSGITRVLGIVVFFLPFAHTP